MGFFSRSSGRLFQAAASVLVVVLSFAAFGTVRSAPTDRLARGLDALLKREFSAGGPGGVVLVAKGGRIVFRRAYGMADIELGVPMRPDAVFRVGSITKQFTAVALLKLVEQGKLKLDDDVRVHVPDFPTHGRRITLEQILTHTSGLPNLVDLKDFETLSQRPHSVAELLFLTKDLPLHFEPGEGFRYSDTGYILLGAVIERVSGRRSGDHLEAEFFRPLGMTSTFYGDDARIIPNRARGYSIRDKRVVNAPHIDMSVPHAAGGLVSTADDLLRWDIALRKGSVVRKELLECAWTGRVLPDGTRSGHGFGWKTCVQAGRRTIEHGGWINGFTACAIRFPDDDLNVVVLVNNDAGRPDAGFMARRAARFILTGSPDVALRKLTPAQRNSLTGRYRLDSEDWLTISEQAGVLYSQRNKRRPPTPLAALSPTELTFADGDSAFVFRFELGADGRAARIRPTLNCEPAGAGVRADNPTTGAFSKKTGIIAFPVPPPEFTDTSKIIA